MCVTLRGSGGVGSSIGGVPGVCAAGRGPLPKASLPGLHRVPVRFLEFQPRPTYEAMVHSPDLFSSTLLLCCGVDIAHAGYPFRVPAVRSCCVGGHCVHD